MQQKTQTLWGLLFYFFGRTLYVALAILEPAMQIRLALNSLGLAYRCLLRARIKNPVGLLYKSIRLYYQPHD